MNSSDGTDLVSLALATVDSALQYGQQKYGLGSGGDNAAASPSHDYSGFNQSPNVEDRRDENSTVQSALGPVYNFTGKAYSIYDRATGNGINPDDVNNPMSQEAGINDIESSKGLQGLGDDGTRDDTAEGQ